MNSFYSENRKSGISLICDIPWGTHFCQFYHTKKDLLEIFIPYLNAGLENNELCVWVTSDSFGEEEAKNVLKKSMPNYEKYAENGQIAVIPYCKWRANDKESDNALVLRLDGAILSGFDGLRLACNDLPENEIDNLTRHTVVALSAYSRENFDTVRVMEIVKKHQFALVHNAGKWEVIESSEARIVKDALERSEEKLQSLFNNMSEGFAYHRILLDAKKKPCDYIFLETNSAFEKLTGLKRKDIIGKRVTKILTGIEKDPARWIEKYGKVALTGKPAQFESYAKALKRWYSVSAFSPHKGYFGVTFSDITERKRAQEMLMDSEQRYATTLTSIGDAVIAADVFGKVTFMNAIAEELTGWKLADAEAQPVPKVFKIINERTRMTVEDPVAKVLKCGMIVGLANHTLLVRKDGREIPIDDSGAPIKNYKGEIVGVVLVFRDITERKCAEDILRRDKETFEKLVQERTSQLVEAQVELEKSKRLSDIGVLAATVAHELRNPLAAISMAAYNIKRKAKNPDLDKHLSNIEKKVGESDQIINNLLFYSRIKSPHYETINISDIIEECVEGLKKPSKKEVLVTKNLDFIKDILIQADPIQIKEVFHNILNNAHDAVPSEKGRISITAKNEDEFIKVAIEDNGIGIGKDILDKVFDPFFTTKAKGTGLGLSVSRQIVKMHKGEIGIKSESGQGTSIIVRLPKKE